VAKLIAAVGAFRTERVHDSRDGLVIGVDSKADEFSRANVIRMASELIAQRGNTVDRTHETCSIV
jgi:hypothetical protein